MFLLKDFSLLTTFQLELSKKRGKNRKMSISTISGFKRVGEGVIMLSAVRSGTVAVVGF